jgi:hypothetical protein
VVVVRRALLGAAVLALIACEPSLDLRTFDVTSPRVLAVRSDPAESLPGKSVTLTTLYVGPSGEIPGGPFDWAFCDARNPLANLGPVSPACAQRSGSVFIELGNAPAVASAVPTDTCLLFGPDVPPAQANEPPGRPVDPDATGGYYQPVRLVAGDQIAIGQVRITCDTPGATPAQNTELAADNHANTNPQIDDVTDPTLGTLVVEAQGTNTVAPAQHVDFTAHWAVCDPTATSCTGSEGYAYLDPLSHDVVTAREEMLVSWFATGGTFDNDSTGRAATDPTPMTDDGWTAPTTPGPAHVWVVLRDDRGGVGWMSYVMNVK